MLDKHNIPYSKHIATQLEKNDYEKYDQISEVEKRPCIQELPHVQNQSRKDSESDNVLEYLRNDLVSINFSLVEHNSHLDCGDEIAEHDYQQALQHRCIHCLVPGIVFRQTAVEIINRSCNNSFAAYNKQVYPLVVRIIVFSFQHI